jgi:hypothetical protein
MSIIYIILCCRVILIKKLTLGSWTLFEKPPIMQVLKNVPIFYVTCSFITCSQEPSTCPYPEPYQSTPSHSISLRTILLSSSHLRPGLPIGLFSSGFPTNILYAFIFSPFRATCPAHLILIDSIIII